MASLTRRLVRLVHARDVAPADLVAAERYVRDWIGSGVAGGAAPTGQILRSYADGTSDLDARVFLSSALSHVTETDDLHNASVTHPGCVVIPVALFLGAERGASGHAVLGATLVGYEVMTRIGEALGPMHYRTFHNTATAGVFGAAAAAASLLDLDEDAWVWALGSAGTQAAGLWQFNDDGAMSKPLHAGHAATAGLRAALLAEVGLTGAEEILEGERGFFRALCPDARPEAVLAASGVWKLPETSMKPYPCCRHVHSVIDAALELRQSMSGGPPRKVRIESYPAALDVTDRPAPRTPHEARFSIQYAVATALLRGRPGLDAFEPDAVVDPEVSALLDKVSVGSCRDLGAAYPERWGARVSVETHAREEVEVLKPSASGDPDAPLDDAELDAKVTGLMEWAGLSGQQITWTLEACRGLVDDGSPGALLAASAVPDAGNPRVRSEPVGRA